MKEFLKTKDIDGKDLIFSTETISYIYKTQTHGQENYCIMFSNGFGKEITKKSVENLFQLLDIKDIDITIDEK